MRPHPDFEYVRFDARGRVVIPGRFRMAFGVEARTRAVVTATPEGILIQPVTRHAIDRLRGSLKRKPGRKSFAEEWAEHKCEERELEERKYASHSGVR